MQHMLPQHATTNQTLTKTKTDRQLKNPSRPEDSVETCLISFIINARLRSAHSACGCEARAIDDRDVKTVTGDNTTQTITSMSGLQQFSTRQSDCANDSVTRQRQRQLTRETRTDDDNKEKQQCTDTSATLLTANKYIQPTKASNTITQPLYTTPTYHTQPSTTSATHHHLKTAQCRRQYF
jgi:hypothetical protein